MRGKSDEGRVGYFRGAILLQGIWELKGQWPGLLSIVAGPVVGTTMSCRRHGHGLRRNPQRCGHMTTATRTDWTSV